MEEGSELSFPDNLAFICAAASIPVPRQVLSVSWHIATALASRFQTAALVAVVKALVGKRRDLVKVGALLRVRGFSRVFSGEAAPTGDPKQIEG